MEAENGYGYTSEDVRKNVKKLLMRDMSSQYLAAWIIAKLADQASAEAAIHYVAPVGEKEATVSHNISVVLPYINQPDKPTD